MAFAMGFCKFITGKSLLSVTALKHSLHAMPVNRSRHIQQAEIKNVHHSTHMKRGIKRVPLSLFALPPMDSTTNTSSQSPAQTILLFYSAINEHNLKQLDKLIAEDCLFEDYSFTKPFQGKKEVLRFIEQLTFCMCRNMQFTVDHICEGNDYTAAVNWHLDWNKIQVPFTRGCSCYSLSIDGDKLVIKKAQVLIESPIKLGEIALAAFKIVTSLFDAFPEATEWFLRSSHIVFQLLLKAYCIAIKPIISPLLEWYIKLLNLLVCILSFTPKILYYLAKFFEK